MSDETDWKEAAERLARIFVERVKEIRRNVPADEIVARAVATFAAAPSFTSGYGTSNFELTDPIDIAPIAKLLEEINESHRNRIRSLANSIGEVVRVHTFPDNIAMDMSGWFAGEEESFLLLQVDDLVIRVSKETATKVLALGFIP